LPRALLLAAACSLACFPAGAGPAAPAAAPAGPRAAPQDADLARFFDDYDAKVLARSPTTRTYRGIRTDYGRWDDFSDAQAVRDHAEDMAALAEMRARFDQRTLSDESRLSFELFEKQMERQDRAFRFRHRSYVFDQMNGAQSELPAFLINLHSVDDVEQAQAYVSRLRGIAPALDQLIELARLNERKGTLPPRWVFPYVIDDARNLLRGAPFEAGTDSTLLADLRTKVSALDAPVPEKERLLADGRAALVQSVAPAYRRLIAFLWEQQARAPLEDGVWRFPDGAGYYAERLAYYTTTDLDAEQVHRIGLENVARIHAEMREIVRRVGFDGDLQAFFQKLRTDGRFYYPDTPEGREAYLAETRKAIDEVQAKLPAWFGTLPAAPLVVKAVEPFRERSAGKAFYQSPAPDGSRPGTYYVNLYEMGAMPSFEVEALAYHEAIPGHHLQRAVSTDLEGLPPFRRFGTFTAYTEGWGLYAEKLGRDMGQYRDPYRDFGRLQLELHRAIRLVVDTGIHHKRWSRQQAIDYVLASSADTESSVVKAIERYIVFPGQATAYMIGRLKISELRDRAERALGERFDIRHFHDQVLLSGAIPLHVLEANVVRWIEAGGAAPRR
jgi:uncharacterized protein (DUF885 family)